MCSPLLAVAGASAGLGVISNVVNYFAIQSAHHATVQAANLNYNMKAQAVDQKNVQLGEQETEANLTNAVRTAQGFGRIAVSATALGLGQYSTRQLIGNNAAGSNRSLGITTRNADQARTGFQTELTGASIQRSSEIANAPHTNLGMLALGIGKSLVGGAADYAALGGKVGMTPVGNGAGPQDGFRQGAQGGGLYTGGNFVG